MSAIDIDLMPLEERPLVTFALFSYNQEKYIREAIEGVLAQTYEPLEIIVSDDCSRDGTYGVICSYFAELRTEKKITINRTSRNLGVWGHLSEVMDLANGDYIVVAAGDDISHPERTVKLIKKMIASSSDASYSNANEINEDGYIIRRNVSYSFDNNGLWRYINSSEKWFIHGGTASYKAEFLREALKLAPPDICYPLNNEDLMLTAMLLVLDKRPICYDNEALIDYRIVNESLSRGSIGVGFKAEKKRIINSIRVNKSKIFYLRMFLKILKRDPSSSKHFHLESINNDLRVAEIELKATANSIINKLESLVSVRNMTELRVVSARLFGINILALMKSISNYNKKLYRMDD